MINTRALKSKMAFEGYTIGRLAKGIGISAYNCGQKISGKRTFDINEAARICALLGIDDDAEKAKIFLSTKIYPKGVK